MKNLLGQILSLSEKSGWVKNCNLSLNNNCFGVLIISMYCSVHSSHLEDYCTGHSCECALPYEGKGNTHILCHLLLYYIHAQRIFNFHLDLWKSPPFSRNAQNKYNKQFTKAQCTHTLNGYIVSCSQL